MQSTTHKLVSDYYGGTLKSSADLKSSACCPIDAVPQTHRKVLDQIHPDVLSKFYGCGSPIPSHLNGCVVLDLGCGTGRDVFLSSPLVGEGGRVIGVDMTDNQLAVAKQYEQFHADRFFGDGSKKNTEFRKGFIEDLKSAGIEDESVDVVISNCVCNLSPDKKAVFREAARVLKQGGELYFSDVYADRRLSPEARKHPVLVAECLGGALYLEDFRRILAEVGLMDHRIVSCGPIQVHDPELSKLVEGVQFYSITIRAFKIDGLEDRRENYGQFAVYEDCCGDGLKLDADYEFRKGIPLPVDKNTAMILQQSRFKSLFRLTEAKGHMGLFSPEIEGGAFIAMMNSSRKDRMTGVTINGNDAAYNGGGCSQVEKAEPSRVVAQPTKATEVKANGCGGSRGCC